MCLKKYCGIALAAVMTVSLAGCGEAYPDMTDDQYKQTVEYAAGLLMKYSNNGQERLMYVDAQQLEKERRKEAEEAAENQTDSSTALTSTATAYTEPEPVQESEQADAGTEAGLEGADASSPETETAEPETSESTESAEADPNAVVLSSDESQEILDDIFLSYQGYSISSTYPESSKSYVVNADKGKKLLVLRFDLYNGSDSDKQVNMIPLNLMFQIIMNGNNLGYSSVTFLPNDLASYSGTIESRAHESVVVLTQIPESDTTGIESLGMIVTMKGENTSVILK